MIKYLLIILISLIIVSCECVPGLDAPKEITPENSTECLLINGIEDNKSIYFETDEIKIAGAINFPETKYEYKKVKAGNYFLKIKGSDSTSVIYNSPINFKKDNRYILAAAGINYNIQTLLLEYDYSATNFTEIINLAGDSKPLEVTVISGNDTLRFDLNPMSSIKLDWHSKIVDMLYIKNNKSELEINQQNISLRNNNLIIIKGNNFNTKSIFLDILSQ